MTNLNLKKSAIEQMCDYLRGRLSAGAWPDGTRMPPLHILAQLAEVSRATAWRALGILSREGLLTTRRGGRPVAGSLSAHRIIGGARLAGTAWERKRTEIEADIVEGRYKPGEQLPTLSELKARYGISSPTLLKSLNSLEQNGMLARHLRRFMVPKHRSAGSPSSIALLAGEMRLGKVNTENTQAHTFINTIEAECSRSNIVVKLVVCNPADPDVLQKVRAQIAGDRTIIGFILDVWETYLPETEKRVLDVVHDLALRKKPIAIFDESVGFRLPLPLSTRQDITIFRIAEKRAGQSVAGALLQRGHRHAAFLTYCKNEAWSKGRFEGIVDRFEKSGFYGSIVPVATGEVKGVWQLVLGLVEMAPEKLGELAGRFLSREQAADFAEQFRVVRSRALFARNRNPLVEDLRTGMRLVRNLRKLNVDKEYFGALFDGIFEAANDRVLDPYLEPLFEEALTHKSVTAWVAAEDGTGVAALRFLRRKKIGVPHDISVISFDNSTFAFQNRLTSYDFNIPGIALQALASILRPGQAHMQSHRQIVEVDGMVIERETIARSIRSASSIR